MSRHFAALALLLVALLSTFTTAYPALYMRRSDLLRTGVDVDSLLLARETNMALTQHRRGLGGCFGCKGGGASTSAASPSRPATSRPGPSTAGPSTAGPSTAGPSTPGPSTAEPSTLGQFRPTPHHSGSHDDIAAHKAKMETLQKGIDAKKEHKDTLKAQIKAHEDMNHPEGSEGHKELLKLKSDHQSAKASLKEQRKELNTMQAALSIHQAKKNVYGSADTPPIARVHSHLKKQQKPGTSASASRPHARGEALTTSAAGRDGTTGA